MKIYVRGNDGSMSADEVGRMVAKERADAISEFESFLEDLESKLQRNVDSGITLRGKYDNMIGHHMWFEVTPILHGKPLYLSILEIEVDIIYYSTPPRDRIDRVIVQSYDSSFVSGVESLIDAESVCYDYLEKQLTKYM